MHSPTKSGPIPLIQSTQPIDYTEAADYFQRLAPHYRYKILLESKDVSPVYGRMSLIGIDPVLHCTGKEENFQITALNERGNAFYEHLDQADFPTAQKFSKTQTQITGTIPKAERTEDHQLSHTQNIGQVVATVLEKFKSPKTPFLGLYGAFSYDFVRLYENLGDYSDPTTTPDFNLFLYDTFLHIDHLKETAHIIVFRENSNLSAQAIAQIQEHLSTSPPPLNKSTVKNAQFTYEKEGYEELVRIAKDYIIQGDAFEIVFANTMKADFSGDPLDLYLKYREINPSPYLFFLDFGEEQLVGASPEMMVRCEDDMVHLRPISGTIERGKNPIEDHENMCTLLNSPKERAELDMLVDLGRNDLTRVCEPGIEVQDYRFVEKYSRVMHTVSHVKGKIRPECTAFDALIATINNGTLTGAPKVRAMQIIEQHERHRRGYYGGTMGYLAFNGNMDTGIIIRTAHITGDHLTFAAGASLVYDSRPEDEYQETINKASAFLSLLE